MILYYALGGGLGHLTRACAVLHTLGCSAPAVILSSSQFTDYIPIPDGVQIRSVPASFARDRHTYRTWLVHLLAELRPTALYLDVFPAGIVGELCDFPEIDEIPVHYVARRLRWDTYARQLSGKIPRFRSTFVLEPLEDHHLEFVNACSKQVSPLTLLDPPKRLSVMERATREQLSTSAEPLWLIVHSGSDEEVRDLISYAQEMRQYEGARARLVVAAPAQEVFALAPAIHTLGFFPASALFPLAERVVSGCGFNVMRQMAPFRQKHYFMPFARRFDDQYWRAAYWRQG